MPISTKVLAGGIAGVALLLSAGAALADPGQATASVNVRSGPGVNYPVVDQLYAGESVDIGQCDGGWCHVDHRGPGGWVSANYLAGADDEEQASPPVYYYDEPEYVPGPVFIGPPGYYDRHHHFHRHWPHRGNPPPPQGGGNPPPPPPGGNPPGHHHHRFPPPGFPNNGNNGQPAPQVQHMPHLQQFHNNGTFQVHPNGQFPGGVRPHVQGPSGGGNSCAIDPAACLGGGQNFHRQR